MINLPTIKATQKSELFSDLIVGIINRLFQKFLEIN